MILSDGLTNSECCFLSDLSRQECHKYTTVNQVSTMQLLGWVTDETDVCLRGQPLLFLSTHGWSTRFRTFKVRGRFQTTLVLLRVHGRIHSTRVFQNSYFNKYTEHQIRSSHGPRARRNETRTSYCSSTRRDQARTSHCVREGNQATSHCSECADQTEESICTIRRART